ncbi:unnamed protein product [Rotaria sordida]|uniref:Uncharacterized protein n=1 Tax=Rotaria sordida TaxID=392033 RepID=A0A819FAB8_9BILA|nr:unnamed protein product [Rotaria sordida]
MKSNGTLHTFRPTYTDQYELDRFSREKYFSTSTNFSNNSILQQEKSMFDMTNNIQLSSMSTTSDLLF